MHAASKPGDALWRVHAGSTGEAEDLFLKGRVAIAFPAPDLRQLSSLEDLKSKLQTEYPSKTPRSIAGHAGRLWTLYQVMKIGDHVLFPRKSEATFKLGKISGPYVFDTKAPGGFVHQRPVEWIREFDRDSVSLSARREVNSLVTIIRVKRNALEFMGMKPKNTISADETPQAEYVDARLARESTEDYVIRRIQERLKGRPFEELVADMWRVMGYRALLNPDGKNGKYDVRAGKGPLGVEPPLLKIECKSAPDAKPDHKDVSSLANQLLAGELGIFIALAGFARGTDREFREKPIRLIDRADFVALFLQLYPELSSRFKDLIPLRREWVPPAEAVPKNEPASADEGSDDDAYSADESLGAL